jgi:hypothetical protein
MTAPTAYPAGAPIWWNHQLRGGYGYTEPAPGIVLGATPKRCWIGVYLLDGTYKRVLVSPDNLAPREMRERPSFPLDSATQTARS